MHIYLVCHLDNAAFWVLDIEPCYKRGRYILEMLCSICRQEVTIGEHITQRSAFFDNIDVHLICCFKSNTLQLLGHYVHKLCCPNQGDCWKINSLVLLMYKLLGWLVLQLYAVEFIVVCMRVCV